MEELKSRSQLKRVMTTDPGKVIDRIDQLEGQIAQQAKNAEARLKWITNLEKEIERLKAENQFLAESIKNNELFTSVEKRINLQVRNAEVMAALKMLYGEILQYAGDEGIHWLLNRQAVKYAKKVIENEKEENKTERPPAV